MRAWSIEIPPEYRTRSAQRPCIRIAVTVLDRGDPRVIEAKAERLARAIAMENPDWPTCWSEAQKDLESLGFAAVPHLRRWLRESNSSHVRAVAAKILGPQVHRGAEGRAELLAGLADADSHVRTMCVAALGGVPDGATIEALLARLADPDTWVRVEAIRAVEKADDARVTPALVASLQDEDGYVRRWAAVALSERGDPSGIRVLVAALEADAANDAFLVVDALETLTGLSFGEADMPACHSSIDSMNEAVRTNEALARRWLAWWESEGKDRYEN